MVSIQQALPHKSVCYLVLNVFNLTLEVNQSLVQSRVFQAKS